MSGYTRQASTLGASRKRKERDGPDAQVATKAEPGPAPPPKPAASAGSRLVAGYLAHEFLTHGTLLGQRPDPARPDSWSSADPVRSDTAGRAYYADVAYLLKADGADIPGIVNPTQLGQWLQMG